VRARGATVRTQLGQRIRELRGALSFTQEALAERAGISVSFLSMIERSERLPHIKTLAALSNALGITLSQLFLDVNEP
jgi:transcriptional regulator with XRE-family HTH domain